MPNIDWTDRIASAVDAQLVSVLSGRYAGRVFQVDNVDGMYPRNWQGTETAIVYSLTTKQPKPTEHTTIVWTVLLGLGVLVSRPTDDPGTLKQVNTAARTVGEELIPFISGFLPDLDYVLHGFLLISPLTSPQPVTFAGDKLSRAGVVRTTCQFETSVVMSLLNLDEGDYQ